MESEDKQKLQKYQNDGIEFLGRNGLFVEDDDVLSSCDVLPLSAQADWGCGDVAGYVATKGHEIVAMGLYPNARGRGLARHLVAIAADHICRTMGGGTGVELMPSCDEMVGLLEADGYAACRGQYTKLYACITECEHGQEVIRVLGREYQVDTYTDGLKSVYDGTCCLQCYNQ